MDSLELRQYLNLLDPSFYSPYGADLVVFLFIVNINPLSILVHPTVQEWLFFIVFFFFVQMTFIFLSQSYQNLSFFTWIFHHIFNWLTLLLVFWIVSSWTNQSHFIRTRKSISLHVASANFHGFSFSSKVHVLFKCIWVRCPRVVTIFITPTIPWSHLSLRLSYANWHNGRHWMLWK